MTDDWRNDPAFLRDEAIRQAELATGAMRECERLRDQLAGAMGMRESRIARARGLAQAIAECRDDARLDGIREGAAEIVQLLAERSR